ncbi:MAG: DUF3795 domain-containing protein [Candidatus Thorarchaeota archaeon]
MKEKDILKIIAPCGLNCYKCFANSEGPIRKTSLQLQKLLGSFDIYAERFSSFLPIFKEYQSFKILLKYFAEENCPGCRNGSCLYPDCGVRDCYKAKRVDYCFQCDEFPCEKSNFDELLKQRWVQINKRMEEIGIESYYQETKNVPRY